MKSIKSQIIVVILSIVVLLCAIFGVMSCYLNYSTATAVLKQTMTETAAVSADRVSAEIQTIQSVAIETGCLESIADPTTPLERKKEVIAERAATYGFQRGNLLGADGVSLFDGNDYSERDYFQASIKGAAYISDPTISKITGKTTFLISAPLWKDGKPNTTVIGVIYYAPNEDFLNNIVQNIKISETGYAYILNKNGTIVADKDAEKVGVENTIEDAKSDPTLADSATIDSKMIAGENGYGIYQYEGVKWVQGYAPIGSTNGWSLGVAAEENDFLANFYLSLGLTIGLALVFILVGLVAATVFASKIGKPIRACSERIRLLSVGDLKTPAPVIRTKDETGVLAEATTSLLASLNRVVGEISHNLIEMSNGNFNLPDLMTYRLDFEPLSTASNHIVSSLNDTLHQISVAADQVSSGSDQVSSGAQALSQGATEQASSIQELSASIAEISEHVRANAQNATEANNLSSKAGESLVSGNGKMTDLIVAMDEISNSSKKISNIIKTINDIAFQTNILALNAAVEAARAGAAGKGFAVVADEVRNLASKSAEAVKDTTELIDGSIKAVANGATIADDTAKTLVVVMDGAKQSTDLVSMIAEASGEQAQSILQVTQGVEQISAVVQTNSATAEQSAAASEELSGQAQMLRTLVKKFSLRGEYESKAAPMQAARESAPAAAGNRDKY